MMKSLLTLLLVLSFKTAFSFNNKNDNSFNVIRYIYEIKCDSISISKEKISDLFLLIPIDNIYFIKSGFTFQSDIEYSTSFLSQLFLQINIQNVIEINIYEIKNNNDIEKVGGVNCEAAEILCSNTTVPGNSSGYGVQELNAGNRGCMYIEHQSSWYYLNVQTGGSLTLAIDPAVNTDDYDFAIWGPFTETNAGANCPPITSPIRCSFSALDDQTGLASSYYGQTSAFGCGFLGLSPCYGNINVTDVSENSSGDSWVMPLSVLSGEVYILLVDNYSTSFNPYSMSFGGSAQLGCTPIALSSLISAFDATELENENLINWEIQNLTFGDKVTLLKTNEESDFIWNQIYLDEIISVNNGISLNSFLDHNVNTLDYYKIIIKDKDFHLKSESEIISLMRTQNVTKIYKRFDLLGREINQNDEGISININEDGTRELVYKTKY